MLTIDPSALEKIARANGWLHETGRLRGTVNAAAVAEALGVNRSTVTRAYDGGRVSDVLIEKLHVATGTPFDEFVRVSSAVAS